MAFLDETTEQEVEKNKAIRGYIMRALARGNNGALLVRQIVNALMADNLIMTPDIGKYLSCKYLKYLEDGGYIAFTARSVSAYNAYRKDAVVQLTKKGIDLVEDTIQDGGVNV